MPNISSVFAELNDRYKSCGMTIVGGYSSKLSDGVASTRGNFIKKNGVLLSSSAGICNDEAYFMHGLGEQLLPKNILIIGNSYGFSTVFLALSNPNSNLLAFDKFRTEGIKVTNNVLKGLKNKLVVQGSTPNDIPTLIDKHFKNKKLDFVLIDAVHTNEMQTAEFEILRDYLSEKSVIIFHDVIQCNLLDSFYYLKKQNKDCTFKLINKTSTGIGICINGEISDELKSFINYFSTSEKEVFDFLTLMFKRKNQSSHNLFKEMETTFEFLPHPQK